jgi:hypothetical protein
VQQLSLSGPHPESPGPPGAQLGGSIGRASASDPETESDTPAPAVLAIELPEEPLAIELLVEEPAVPEGSPDDSVLPPHPAASTATQAANAPRMG